MSWEPWSRVDDQGLARYVTPEATRWLTLDISRFDTSGQPDERRLLVEAIYNALLKKNIRYAFEEYHPAESLQPIRPPAAILDAPREGTCLDLAALFCGLCLGNELLPILIVLEGHALVAVSLTHGLREWNSYRPARALFETGPLTDPAPLREWIDEGSYIAVECTGFAHSEVLGQIQGEPPPECIQRVDGVLSFERAIAAGREQLDLPARPLQFALDIAVVHYSWRIEPHQLDSTIFQVLAQAPAPLSTFIRVADFEPYVNERTRDFVGRDFIFQAIDNALAEPAFPSAYIVIRGEPGIGKTALMGQLVKQRGYVHHFNIAAQNIRSPSAFLSNICAQLIVRYKLDHPTLPPKATEDSGFLAQLLAEAASKASNLPVVVLVDALDESEDVGLPRGANVLYLPKALPDGVFFIVSSREKVDYHLTVDRIRAIYLQEDDPQNKKDVVQYINNFIGAHRATMELCITDWGVDEEKFVEVITAKSQGNFMYLVYVLADIHDGRLAKDTIDDIQNLPEGLRAYYSSHWEIMKAQDPDRFERIYEPIVCTLAVVREPVTIAQLMVWTQKLTDVQLTPIRIKEVIGVWRQFLNESQSGQGEPLYRIYHASFQDFLRDEVGLAPYHNTIAQTALDKIPGFGGEN
jgi:hypothetical protein